MYSMLLPALILMMVTMIVWLNMFILRLLATKSLNLDPQDLATPEQVLDAFDEATQAPSNCLKNLFELPVIFYALTAYLMAASLVDALYLNLAWAFVALRALQACVHCTYNRVMHRFLAYLASSLILWFMVIRLFLSLI